MDTADLSSLDNTLDGIVKQVVDGPLEGRIRTVTGKSVGCGRPRELTSFLSWVDN